MPTSKANNHLAKFCHPRVDPKPNLIVDNRSEQQKLERILRTLNQILTKDQLEVWNQLAERDLAISENYSSGIPKLKSCISHEIEQYKLSKRMREWPFTSNKINFFWSIEATQSPSQFDYPGTIWPRPRTSSARLCKFCPQVLQILQARLKICGWQVVN